MKIDLDSKYSIKTDENNFVLIETKIKGNESKKAGEVYESTVGYYGTLEQCLKGYVKNYLRKNEDISNIKELISSINLLNETIKRVK